MTEFDFIRQFLQKQQAEGLVLGIGDDAAIIRPSIGFDLCFSADMLALVEQIHSPMALLGRLLLGCPQ